MMFTIIMAGGVVAGVLGLTMEFMPEWAAIVVIVVAYLIYFIGSICTSGVFPFIFKMKALETYKKTYAANRSKGIQWKFKIECYHYSYLYVNGVSSRTKEVTHTAYETFKPKQCVDVSGQVDEIDNTTKNYLFVFFDYKYSFIQDNGKQILEKAFNRFVAANRRDSHQDYDYTL